MHMHILHAVYLATHGVDPKSHLIKRELVSDIVSFHIYKQILSPVHACCSNSTVSSTICFFCYLHLGTSAKGYEESERNQ